MTRLRGAGRRSGERLPGAVPFGPLAEARPFIAGLRCKRIDGTDGSIEGAMGSEPAFDLYIETQAGSDIAAGRRRHQPRQSQEVHASIQAAASLKGRGAWFLFLPAYSPDLNPIEMAFAKLKAALRKAAARSGASPSYCASPMPPTAFTPRDCVNFFAAAGYGRV